MHFWINDKRGWQTCTFKIVRYLVLARAIPERLRDQQLIIKRYSNKAYLYLLLTDADVRSG